MVNDLRERVSLRPCPFCGPTRQKPILHKGKGVKCHACGAWGPAWEKPTGEEWNTRADDALSEIGGGRVKPLTEEERAEVINDAHEEYRKSQRGVRGQTITEWDSIESWVVQATERRILAAIEPAPVKMQPRASVSPDHAWEPVSPSAARTNEELRRAIAEGKDDD